MKRVTCIRRIDFSTCLLDNGKKVRYVLPKESFDEADINQGCVHEKKILNPSVDRVKIPCPIFYSCGGCDRLHIRYAEQLRMKERYVKDLFSRVEQDRIDPIIGASDPFHYRHKAIATATTKNKRLKLGLYAAGTKKVIPYLGCHIQDGAINACLKTIEDVLNQYRITAYDIDSNQGIMKHVVIRKSYQRKTLLVTFVTNGNLFPNHKKIISRITTEHPLVKTVVQNIHNRKTPVVLEDRERLLYGPKAIIDDIEDYSFELSSRSFYQVHPVQMVRLYQKAIMLARLKKDDVVLDLYAGIGTISLLVSTYVKKVIAVENNPKAYGDAMANAKRNDVHNVHFVLSDVESYMNELNMKMDCVILDPPREGATPSFLFALKRLKPEKIVYISCNPLTQTRDVKVLEDTYLIERIAIVDMFPHTRHVESVTFLSLKTS
jgi:23S rRNA (uracil1939-C5)-methyltransferase